MDTETLARFSKKFRIDEVGCWIWKSPMKCGYGGLWYRNREDWEKKWMRYAHRLSYEHFKGPIPEGLQLDHLCRVRICVNPDHLEAVTPKQNVERGSSGSRAFCLRGHEKKRLPAGKLYCPWCASDCAHRVAVKRLGRHVNRRPWKYKEESNDNLP